MSPFGTRLRSPAHGRAARITETRDGGSVEHHSNDRHGGRLGRGVYVDDQGGAQVVLRARPRVGDDAVFIIPRALYVPARDQARAAAWLDAADPPVAERPPYLRLLSA